ncbi:hypothetical protein B0O99DRAFT_654698 [Bisporella sp. PMI_857]|nr:hypothetical protein B0O99DRAFT_654698 [Bisporella sp. PMI_857]
MNFSSEPKRAFGEQHIYSLTCHLILSIARVKTSGKAQKTIEETLVAKEGAEPANKRNVDDPKPGDVLMSGVEDDGAVAEQIEEDPQKFEQRSSGQFKEDKLERKTMEKKDASIEKEEGGQKDREKNAFDESVVEDEKREAQIPSSILEKGIIYFFFRGCIGVEDPQDIEDTMRSYILGDGPLHDGNVRLLALPKKVLPNSNRDRFLVFVEKSNSSIKDLRDQFSSVDYPTKTTSTSHTPAATPFAEGVYAITSTGRASHLAYHITYPEIGEAQKELGAHERGSYTVSTKNPKAPGPANATLDNPAEYPEHIRKKFRNLRWMPLEPELLDYENTQVLIIGEGMGNYCHSLEEVNKDQRGDEKVAPVDEIEKLLNEDHERVHGLKDDDPVFVDLGLSSKGYPKMQTTW